MSDKLINKVITISSMENKAGQFGGICKIKDENNHTYTVYEKKKDNTTSVAWEQLQTFKIGTTVQVGFAEQPGEYQGKKYISRIIRNFNEDIGNGVRNAEDQGKNPYGAKSEASGQGNDEFGRRLGVHGLVNGMLANPDFSKQEPAAIVKYAIEIEDEINKQLNPSKFRQTVQKLAPALVEDLPTIQQDDGLSDEEVEGIPF